MQNPVKVIERTDIGRNIDFASIPNDAEAKAALIAANGGKLIGVGGKKVPIGELYGKARSLPKGTIVDLRIDIPTFNRQKVYVVTVHKPKTKAGGPGDVIGYENIGRVTDPVFIVNKAVSSIYEGKSDKFPVATVHGKFDPRRTIPNDIEEWTPVGMDPKEHAFFYDKRNDRPVVGGKDAISVGNTVFVKDPVYGKRKDYPNPRRNPLTYPSQDITYASLSPTPANAAIAAGKALWETSAFKKWFGDSKVRDLAGRPAVLYHGTCSSGFARFDPTKTREMGFHFGTSSQAKDFLKGCGTYRGKTPGIYPVYLSIQKPLFTPDVYSESPTFFIEWLERSNNIHEWFPDEDDSYYRSLNKLRTQLVEANLLTGEGSHDYRRKIYKTIWSFLRKIVMRKGYDGIRYKNENEGNTDDPYNIAWIAFSPAQVKSATENRGTFDRRDPDLRNPRRSTKGSMIRTKLSRIIEPGDRVLDYDRAKGEELYRLWDLIHTDMPLTEEALTEIEGMLDDDGVLVIQSGEEPFGLRKHFRRATRYDGMLLVQGPLNPEEARINTEKLRRDLE